MKILVADDTRSNLLFLKACIEAAGYEVYIASNGSEALEVFDKFQPDLVLLDVDMPEMNGIEAAKQIRQRDRKHWVPIIFISANGKDKDVVQGLESGGDEYIVKPVSQAVLNARLRAMKRIYDMQNELEKVNLQLRQFADQDPLTGLANRRKYDEFLRREWARSVRNNTNLSLAICDVDYFKQYNDIYGHQKGDEALAAVAGVLKTNIRRPADLVARVGGEEFAVILPETEREGAIYLMNRVRNELMSRYIQHKGSRVNDVLTISIGLTTVKPTQNSPVISISDLVKRADDSLYRAKADGRNQAICYECIDCPIKIEQEIA